MFTKPLKIKKVNILFVFRYRYEKQVRYTTMWNDWKLGFFFKVTKIVGMKYHKTPKLWGKGLVRSYMLGIDLLLIKVWIEFDVNGFRIDEKNT